MSVSLRIIAPQTEKIDTREKYCSDKSKPKKIFSKIFVCIPKEAATRIHFFSIAKMYVLLFSRFLGDLSQWYNSKKNKSNLFFPLVSCY